MEPTKEQFDAWLKASREGPNGVAIAGEIARLAYQAGADAELEACCEWLSEAQSKLGSSLLAHYMRRERRPKPPSLKQQAMVALDALIGQELRGDNPHAETLARFLNSLPDD